MKTTIKLPKNITSTEINSTKVAILSAVIIVTIMLFVSTAMIDFDSYSTLSSMMICAAIVGVIASGIMSCSLKHDVLTATHSPIMCKSIEFKESLYLEVQEAAVDNNWSKVKLLARESYGTAMMIEFVYSKDKRFAAYQIFKYVPHIYEPCGDIVYLDKECIDTFCNS